VTASLPVFNGALLVGTDFTDDRSWEVLCAEAMTESVDGFVAGVSPVGDPSFDGSTWQEIEGIVPHNDHGSSIVFIADSVTMSSADHPILVANISRYRRRRARGTPASTHRAATSRLPDSSILHA
jgi:hypothetical protein